MNARRRRGFSLVEMVVVIVIIGALAAFLLPRYLSGGKTADGKTVESPKQRGQSVECMGNLRQIRSAYQMATTADEENRPKSLADLRPQGVSETMTRCTVTGQPYRFDPAAGSVQCPSPGHNRY